MFFSFQWTKSSGARAQGRNEGGTIPRALIHYGGAESLRGHRITELRGRRITGVAAEKSQQCQKYFPQCIKFAFERAQVPLWGRQTSFLPRAPSNLVTPLLEPKTSRCWCRSWSQKLDAWSWIWSLKFEFRLHSPSWECLELSAVSTSVCLRVCPRSNVRGKCCIGRRLIAASCVNLFLALALTH